MSRRLPLGGHILVQMLSLAMIMPHNHEVCGVVTAYPAASSMLSALDTGMRLMAALFPSPVSMAAVFAARVDGSQQQCMVVTAMLQLLVGFAFPTAVLAAIEATDVGRFWEGCSEGDQQEPPRLHDRCLLWLRTKILQNCTIISSALLFSAIYSIVFSLVSLIYGVELMI